MNLAATTACLLAAAAGAVQAAPGALHENPGGDDNLRIYAFLDAPKVEISLDGAALSSIDGQSVMFTKLAPGAHRWMIKMPDGSNASADFNLSADGMIESKGRRWWCIAAGRPAGQLSLRLLPAQQCKSITDQAPD